MTNEDKRKLLIDIICTKEELDKALHLYSHEVIDFDDMMDKVTKAWEKLDDAVHAYDRMVLEEETKQHHKEMDIFEDAINS